MHSHPNEPDIRNVEILTGEPKRAVRYLLVPLLLSLLVVQLNVFVDNIWCSSLGVEAVSAISVVASIYYFFSHTAAGLGIGLNVAIANCIGADDKEGAQSRAVQILILTAVISVIIIPICYYFTDELIDIIGGQSIKELCRQYLHPMFILSPFLLLHGLFSGMLNGEGASRKTTILSITAAVTNIVLDPIFIFGFGMGVAGASLATCISCVASVCVALFFYRSGRTYLCLTVKKLKFVKDELKDVLYVAMPQVLEQNIGSVANLLMMLSIIGCGGSLGLTLYNLPWKVVHLIMVPAYAIAAAMIPVISANMGRKNREGMRTAFMYGFRLIVLIGLFMTVFVFIGADVIMILFSNSGEMVQYRSELARVMRIYCPFIVFYGLISFGSSGLSAVKRSDISAFTVFVRNALLVGIVYLCCQYTMDHVYWGVTVSEILGGAMMTAIAFWYFKHVYQCIGEANPERNAIK